MHEQNERDLMFEVKLVCDLLCSILPFTVCKAQKVYRHLIGGKPSSRLQSCLLISKSYFIVKHFPTLARNTSPHNVQGPSRTLMALLDLQ